ncbi:hypothetical protein KEF85_05835 [Methylomonas paludis]|uniref:Uncharacterized protein n=1 Tax=Methylomonas paludis TaxID=1173101 RepID=A0A975RB43_9GAMM|nr:hypothetical protein [Methylomonas paludis]QWF71974.1 hypothetical protein KEF85_05835 [Methylomonas paludis]
MNPTPAQVRSQTAGLYGSQNNTILTGSQGDNSAVAGKLGRQTLLGQ